jgi:tetratricopeptide (TPR) repeat protein
MYFRPFLPTWLALIASLPLAGSNADDLVRNAVAAESALDARGALERYLAADRARPDDPAILQRIARQYSDLSDELANAAERRSYAERAVAFAERARALDPENPVNVLSVAIAYGKLALNSDTRARVAHSRKVREEAEEALRLDPRYAWAHHVLGRWHREVIDLNPAERFFVRMLYGGLPEGSISEAIGHLARAVELEPGECAHHIELGFAWLVAGEKAKARGAFQRGLALPSRAGSDESAKARAKAALARM